MFLKISENSQKNTFARVSFLIKLFEACNFIKKVTLAQVFSCEFSEIFKNTFLTEYLWATTSDDRNIGINPYHATGFFLHPMKKSEN